MTKLQNVLGLSGVAPHERETARRWGRIFDYMVIFAVVWLAWQWQQDMRDVLSTSQNLIYNCSTWLFFVVKIAVLVSLVRDKKAYLRSNWMLMVLAGLGTPLIFGAFLESPILLSARLLLIALLLVPWIEIGRAALSDNRIGTTILAALIIVLLFGILMAGFDPGILNALDGVWWAWVTVTTVGYGDVVPVSWVGRIFGAVLILMGLALFSVITANFAAYFIRRGIQEVKLEEIQIEETIEDEIMTTLRDVQQRLERIEKQQAGKDES